MTHRRCPVCGQSAGGQLVTDLRLRTPDGHPLQGGYTVVSCRDCHTGFADVVVPDAYYENYYANLAKYGNQHGSATTAVRPKDPEGVVDNTTKTAKRIRDLLDVEDARILDIGCSTGALLSALHLAGFDDLMGIDPSPDSVSIARTREGVRAAVGSFAEIPTGIGKFDCICLTGVLEHIWDIPQAVQTTASLLKDGGLIYIEVPDAERYIDPFVAPYEDFSTEHINHLSLNSLRILAQRFKMKIVHELAYENYLTSDVLSASIAVAWQPTARDLSGSIANEGLRDALFSYANRSAKDFENLEAELNDRLRGSSEYILWGIGETAFKLLALPPLASRRALAYVDSNPSRRRFTFDDSPIIDPNQIPSGPVPIIASTLIRADSIEHAWRNLGLANPFVRLDQLLN